LLVVRRCFLSLSTVHTSYPCRVKSASGLKLNLVHTCGICLIGGTDTSRPSESWGELRSVHLSHPIRSATGSQASYSDLFTLLCGTAFVLRWNRSIKGVSLHPSLSTDLFLLRFPFIRHCTDPLSLIDVNTACRSGKMAMITIFPTSRLNTSDLTSYLVQTISCYNSLLHIQVFFRLTAHNASLPVADLLVIVDEYFVIAPRMFLLLTSVADTSRFASRNELTCPAGSYKRLDDDILLSSDLDVGCGILDRVLLGLPVQAEGWIDAMSTCLLAVLSALAIWPNSSAKIYGKLINGSLLNSSCSSSSIRM